MQENLRITELKRKFPTKTQKNYYLRRERVLLFQNFVAYFWAQFELNLFCLNFICGYFEYLLLLEHIIA